MISPIWLDLLDEAAQLCAGYGRQDLAGRLRRQRATLLDPKLRVVLIGEPKQGKSQLINALVNAPACPVGDGVTTEMCTVVHHAAEPAAALVHTPAGATGAGAANQPGGRTPVPVAELASRISAGQAAGPGGGPVHAEVGMPRELLAAGLVLVDTPAAAGGDPGAETDPQWLLATQADVVILVTDATRELSATELALLQQASREHAVVLVALTKIDIVPHWRQVAESNRAHLADAGVPAALLPVSAALRLQAAQANDRAINAESGFPELIARLLRYLRGKPDVLAPPAAGLLVSNTVQQLAAPLRAQLSATGSSEPLARLQQAQRSLDGLRRRATRWQNALGDELTDLLSDVEYDLRDRTRQILREAEDAFEAADPSRTWEDYQAWLERSLTEAAEANFAWLVERCEHAAGRIADHFAQYGVTEPPAWREELPRALQERLPAIEQPTLERFTLVQKVFTGLRGSYLGVLLFGLATTFVAGMPLLNPISVGAGVLFAGKSIFDESKQYLKRRQAAAKAASQRHIDTAFLRLSKEYKDIARRVQRILRDYYTTRSEQIHDDIVRSLRTAKEAADADAVERDQRQREIQQRIRRLSALYERAQTLTRVRSMLAADSLAAGGTSVGAESADSMTPGGGAGSPDGGAESPRNEPSAGGAPSADWRPQQGSRGGTLTGRGARA